VARLARRRRRRPVSVGRWLVEAGLIITAIAVLAQP
jgi:hypothetical protein